MIIADTQLRMAVQHAYSEQYTQQEHIQAWVGQRPAQPTAQAVDNRLALRPRESLEDLQHRLADLARRLVPDFLELSGRARALAPVRTLVPMTSPSGGEEEEEPYYDFETSLIKLLVERMTGRKIHLVKPGDFNRTIDPVEPPPTEAPQPGNANPAQGWGLVYDYYSSYQESESLTFSTQGLVRTADGQEIQVDLSLNMSREFVEQQQLSIRAGDALTDPLVVNYGGNAAELGQRSFAFDLDVDGRLDQVAVLQPGSGFLSLDRNGDGVINDGSELFGPRTGSGFDELARYDQDGNGWIDQGDSLYDRLRIWSKDEAGGDLLLALGQANIGALYLRPVSTPFQLKDAENQLLGQVRETGIFLREDGSSGTLQELDLVA
jgi:hypothetical protein